MGAAVTSVVPILRKLPSDRRLRLASHVARSLSLIMLALANGVRQSVTLEATNFKHYSVTVPDGSLPLELSLTKLNGEAALYVSPTGLGPHSRPRPRAARMSQGRYGDRCKCSSCGCAQNLLHWTRCKHCRRP